MTYRPFHKRLFGGAALLLAFALAAGTALAQHAPGRFARGIRAAMAALDLSDAQREKVKAIFASHKDEGIAFRVQAKANRQALKAAASAANPDAVLVGTAF
ncbi:MAG: periplasmic heavy metal sensor, partial [Thermoanaerobaculia bacterium]